ncbi:MAG: MarR family transcriptional regulator, partial [Ignavibacteria bacterium]
MKLESEIKQEKFRSEYQKLAINILYTGGWLSLKNHGMLKPFNLTIQQYNILRILKGQHPNPATVNLLIERMMDKMSNASRIVDRLEEKELVVRKQKSDDRRCVDVMITAKGIKLLEKIKSTEEEFEENFKHLTLKEAKTLNDLLDKLR